MMVTDPVGVCSDFSATFCSRWWPHGHILSCLPLFLVSPKPHPVRALPSIPLPLPLPTLNFHPLLQLCEVGYALDMGECTQCLAGAIGRVTTFGLIVISAISGVALVVLALHFLKVGPFACFCCVPQSNECTRDHPL